MRTTVRLDEKLLADVKKLAVESGRTLTAVLEDALREAVTRRKQRRKAPPVELATFAGQGLQPGVDLDDSSALLDLMEGRN